MQLKIELDVKGGQKDEGGGGRKSGRDRPRTGFATNCGPVEFVFDNNVDLDGEELSVVRSLVEACNEGDINKVRKLLNEGRVSVHDTTEEGESLLSLACSAGYYELAQVFSFSVLKKKSRVNPIWKNL